MDLEDIFVSGPYGRQVLRFARRSACLCLVNNDRLPVHRERATSERATSAQGLPCLTDFGIELEEGRPAKGCPSIDLWFADQASRCQMRGVRCHLSTAASITKDAFVRVQALDHHGVCEQGRCIRCESPNFSVLHYARELHALQREGKLSPTDVIVLLTAYVMELLGSYAKDPIDPKHGQDAFKLEAATTKQSLLSFFERMRGYPCVTIARKAASLAVEGSASRMETVSTLAATLPPRFGGASIEGVELNRPLELSERDLKLIKHRSIRPDLFWEAYRLVVEYDGTDSHSAPKQKREDKYRMQDYQTLGFTALPISYEDVATIFALDRLLLRMVEIIGRDRGRQYIRNKRRLIRDPGHREKRKRLLELLLPHR